MTIHSDIRLTELAGQIKQAAVAGLFYPDDPAELRQMIRQLLDQASVAADPPKALIAPHAGYIYSGAVAASAYATLTQASYRIKRVILLGPAHRVHLKGIAVSRADQFATPLGMVAIDRELRQRLSRFPHVRINEQAFAQEHSIEVHLPFLQSVLHQFSLLPLVVGDATVDQVAEILQEVWGGDETLIVVSSDLSHYHDYATAKLVDEQTSKFIQSLQFDKFGPDRACGSRPIHGLLQVARQKNMQLEILDVRNSGDTAGNRDRVVGYGAYALHAATTIHKQHQHMLLDIAIASIENGFRHNKAHMPDLHLLPAALQLPSAIFVSLFLDDRLRGCIGTTEANSPLASGVAINAYNAAFRDPRFPQLTRTDFGRIDLGISVLTEKSELEFDSEQSLLDQLQPGIHGLIIAKGARKATFLPSVWETLPQAEKFLAQLKQKAGIAVHEQPELAWTYGSCSFSRRLRTDTG